MKPKPPSTKEENEENVQGTTPAAGKPDCREKKGNPGQSEKAGWQKGPEPATQPQQQDRNPHGQGQGKDVGIPPNTCNSSEAQVMDDADADGIVPHTLSQHSSQGGRIDEVALDNGMESHGQHRDQKRPTDKIAGPASRKAPKNPGQTQPQNRLKLGDGGFHACGRPTLHPCSHRKDHTGQTGKNNDGKLDGWNPPPNLLRPDPKQNAGKDGQKRDGKEQGQGPFGPGLAGAEHLEHNRKHKSQRQSQCPIAQGNTLVRARGFARGWNAWLRWSR
jgi:hypothetical protein